MQTFEAMRDKVRSGKDCSIQRIAIATNIVIALLFGPFFAQAMAPNPSKFCTSILLAQREIDRTNSVPSRYTLNSVNVFRRYLEAKEESDYQAGVHRGMAIYTPGTKRVQGSFSRDKLISQIEGIRKFSETSESESPENAQSTTALTLVGTKNIQEFLTNLALASQTRGWAEHGAEIVVRVGPPIFFGIGALIASVSGDNLFANLIGWALMGHVIQFDQTIRRNFGSLPRFKQTIQSLIEISSDDGKGGWAVMSQNAMLTKEVLSTVAQIETRRDFLDYHLAEQTFIDAEASGVASFLKEFPARQWVGVDLILDHRSDEPELHLIIRQTKDRPIFPKTKLKESKSDDLSPILLPGLKPALVPVKD